MTRPKIKRDFTVDFKPTHSTFHHIDSFIAGIPDSRSADAADTLKALRDTSLAVIRHCVPLIPLFKPELKIDLGIFIQDQMLIQRIATYLAPLQQATPIKRESIAQHFANSELLAKIKALFKHDPIHYLAAFEEACVDVLNNKGCTYCLKPALEGRIFTLKNALIALYSPPVILKNQTQHGITSYDIASIQTEGAHFVHQALSIHLYSSTAAENATFREQLVSTATQLVPFVQKVTKVYLKENHKTCPDNPLTFRNPTGYNYHGLVAATVMEVALHALGYKTHLLDNNLEPRVTLAITHGVIAITAPDHTKYMVDASYIQFHKDICLDDTLLPTAPVLVLKASEIDSYIENTLMVHWRTNLLLFNAKDPSMLQKLADQDQVLAYSLINSGVPLELLPADAETWIRQAFKRVWTIDNKTAVRYNSSFQEIFNGSTSKRQTYDYVKAIGLAALSQYHTVEQVEKRLGHLIYTCTPRPSDTSSLKVLALFAQLPISKQTYYAPLLDCDSRITSMSVILNAYFRELRKQVNPNAEDKKVVYGCSGADCTSVMLATDAKEFTFVDLTTITYPECLKALAQLGNPHPLSVFKINEQLEKTHNFIGTRSYYGGDSSTYMQGKHAMDDMALKLFFNLKATGVNLNQVVLTHLSSQAALRLEFPWCYQGATSARKRTITLVTANITQPATYPPILQHILANKIDIFYMKAAMFAPKHYPQFLPQLVHSIVKNGWVMTADKTFMLDAFNPEACLKENGLICVQRKSPKAKMFEKLMCSFFEPLIKIPTLECIPQRIRRIPAADHTYWAILNTRQKTNSPGS